MSCSDIFIQDDLPDVDVDYVHSKSFRVLVDKAGSMDDLQIDVKSSFVKVWPSAVTVVFSLSILSTPQVGLLGLLLTFLVFVIFFCLKESFLSMYDLTF